MIEQNTPSVLLMVTLKFKMILISSMSNLQKLKNSYVVFQGGQIKPISADGWMKGNNFGDMIKIFGAFLVSLPFLRAV